MLSVFLVLCAALVFALILIGKHRSQESRIAEWAAGNGFSIAGPIEKAGLLEPTPFWLNQEHDDVFKVELVDRDSRRRTSWFRFRLLGMEQAWKD